MFTAVLQQGLTEHLPLGTGSASRQFYLTLVDQDASGGAGKETDEQMAGPLSAPVLPTSLRPSSSLVQDSLASTH